MDIKVYDKVKWHYPEGKNCHSLDHALLHFNTIINWLKKKDLLTKYGNDLVNSKLDEEFSLTSEMLKEKAIILFDKYYKDWIKTIEYGYKPDMNFWESKTI